MNTIIINGIKIQTDSGNISVSNGRVIVDGKHIKVGELHKQGKLEHDIDHSRTGDYYWEVARIPKRLKQGDKIYFATMGNIRGYFKVEEITYWGQIRFNTSTWHEINPVSIIHFQGFKYADSVPELKE